jgi:hypothetical protein
LEFSTAEPCSQSVREILDGLTTENWWLIELCWLRLSLVEFLENNYLHHIRAERGSSYKMSHHNPQGLY